MSIEALRTSIERAERVFVAKPEAAIKENPRATARIGNGLRCEITGPDGEQAASDMPVAMGGAASAPVPGWYLRAAMASCTATSIRMRAASLGIELRQLEVSAYSKSDARGLLGMGGISAALGDLRMTVRISAGNATPEQLRELVLWGEDHSPVGCTIRAAPACDIGVEVVEA